VSSSAPREEIQQSGTFGFTSQSMPYARANQLFKG
jgi:hypothetical protein